MMFGPGQMVTAFRDLRNVSWYFEAAALLSPIHKHSLVKTDSICFNKISGSEIFDFRSLIFSFWYCFEAVQMGCSENSVLKARCFSVHGLPGLLSFILFCFPFSALVPF